MAADIVKDIRFLQIVELVSSPNEAGRREAAPREMREENIVGDKPRHRNDPPSGGSVENVIEVPKIRDAICRDTEPGKPLEVLPASTSDQKALLAFEQKSPDSVLLLAIHLPVLLDRTI